MLSYCLNQLYRHEIALYLFMNENYYYILLSEYASLGVLNTYIN